MMSNPVESLEIDLRNENYLDDISGESMIEFFLRYRGHLHSATKNDSRTKEKMLIRRQLSPQLRSFCQNHPTLKRVMEDAINREKPIRSNGFVNSEEDQRRFAHAAIGGWKFVPLVLRGRRWICELKVTFLRRNDPGQIYSGGDLDNRIKTLFDGLRMPYEAAEIIGPPENDDNLCFCLLEDDALISGWTMETGRLWGPLDSNGNENGADVDINMHVTVRTYNQDLGFI
jgi:hypothetical protein